MFGHVYVATSVCAKEKPSMRAKSGLNLTPTTSVAVLAMLTVMRFLDESLRNTTFVFATCTFNVLRCRAYNATNTSLASL